MLSKYYINDFVTYTKSGSMSSDGTYIYSSVTGSTGVCRIEPVTDNEGESTHRIFMDVISLDHVDTIYVDGDAYEIKGINNYQNSLNSHHLELDVFVV